MRHIAFEEKRSGYSHWLSNRTSLRLETGLHCHIHTHPLAAAVHPQKIFLSLTAVLKSIKLQQSSDEIALSSRPKPPSRPNDIILQQIDHRESGSRCVLPCNKCFLQEDVQVQKKHTSRHAHTHTNVGCSRATSAQALMSCWRPEHTTIVCRQAA